jgi:transcriptional regulator with GAF, ATPase, and Fis domain
MKDPSGKNSELIQEISSLKQRIKELEQKESAQKETERRQHLMAEILGILNDPSALNDAISSILTVIKRETGFEAVGIRLRSGEDFPYFVQNGFSHDFLLTENTLIVRDNTGDVCRDEEGNISLECTCGLVISGKADPANPLFTKGGSAWTNNSLPILDLSSDQDPRLKPRNRCIHEGFLSVALIPIRANQGIVGLLQLNDRKKNCFTLDMIHFFEEISASIGVALIRKQLEEERERLVLELKEALSHIKTLRGFLPICSSCKKIRNDKGYWEQVEVYIRDHSEAEFSHSICPECAEKMYPEFYKKK